MNKDKFDQKLMGNHLREAAEAQLAQSPQASAVQPSKRLLHELQVHQIELEMQNDALRYAQNELQVARDRYADLYDFAPVGYLTLNPDGMIAEINLTGVKLLGKERKKLLQKRFTALVIPDHRDRWTQFFLSVKKPDGKGRIELALQCGDGATFQAQLDCERGKVGVGDTAIRVVLSDITERKQTEMRLRESEQHFRTLANCGSALVWTSGLDKLCNYFNEPWLRFTGRLLEQELGNGWAEGVHPDDFDRCLETYVTSFDQRKPFSMDYRIRHADGSYRWISDDGNPRYDSNGEFLGYIGYCMDISNRKQMEISLLDSEERYRLLFETSRDAILITNPEDGSTLAANPVACEMFGYSHEELCRLGRAGIMDATDPRLPDLVANRSRHGHVRARVRCIKSNGDVFSVKLASVVFRDSKHRPRAVVHIRDISEQLRAEKDLHESEMRWQFAVESHGDAMWDWDAGKDELFLTAAARELFNLLNTDSKQRIADLLMQMYAEDRVLVQGQIDDIISGKASEWMGECRVSSSGDTPRWVATRGRVMTRGNDGRPQRIVSISRDVTERKLSEAEGRRQRELVAQRGRLMLLGELASALAHEINQPLTAITGFAAACARKSAGIPEVQELARAIEEQAMRAGEIAWRMRGFARRQRLGRSALSLHEIVTGVAKWIRMDSAYSDVAIDISGVGSTLPPIIADRVELEQVLVNLVRNGIEAALPNVTEHRIAIVGYAAEPPGRIEVSVTDWGQGLPADMDSTNFQPFTSSKEEGLGLGLTICRSIIERHGGHLWATPNPEGGTIFHFTLPIADQVVPSVQEEIQAVQIPLSFPES
jgi:PAS domain S-box-containing protein